MPAVNTTLNRNFSFSVVLIFTPFKSKVPDDVISRKQRVSSIFAMISNSSKELISAKKASQFTGPSKGSYCLTFVTPRNDRSFQLSIQHKLP